MTSIWFLLTVLICTARGQRQDICQDGVCDCQRGENTATILVVKCVCDQRTQLYCFTILLLTLVTLPSSTASPESIFPTLKRLKGYLRNTMAEDCLTRPAFLRELILNSGLLAKLPFINRFTVQDCNDLVLTKDSFKYAHQLQVLSIKRTRNVTLAIGVFSSLNSLNIEDVEYLRTWSISGNVTLTIGVFSSLNSLNIEDVEYLRTWSISGNVTLTMGVFSSLNSLNIEDVEYLRFEPGSFMGASGVSTISIRRSFISELPIFALYNMTGLRTFELDNVNLGNIKSQSLHLQMDNYQSRFIMTNCTIQRIEQDGINVATDKIELVNCTINQLETSSFQMKAFDELHLESCVFGEWLSQQSFLISSPYININQNIFKVFYLTDLFRWNNKTGNKLTNTSKDLGIKMANNTIHKLNISFDNDLVSNSFDSDMIDFSDNEIRCDCSLSQLFVPDRKSQKLFNVTRRNFCISSCNRSFSAMESELSSVCRTESSHVVLGSEALCPVTTVEPKAGEVTGPSRDDRVLHFSTVVPSHRGKEQLHYSGSGTLLISLQVFIVLSALLIYV
uniref:Uncharacterized protein n=1 Tax=Timema shepardi TaxID=629360 RepID=A0A7R9G766_TIMSH|nr:unnamed protein product [Timema shepardi]